MEQVRRGCWGYGDSAASVIPRAPPTGRSREGFAPAGPGQPGEGARWDQARRAAARVSREPPGWPGAVGRRCLSPYCARSPAPAQRGTRPSRSGTVLAVLSLHEFGAYPSSFRHNESDGAVRTYRDPEGTEWMVYLVAPGGGASPRLLPPEYQTGWICFEATDSKRRLVPVPADWESCAENTLDVYRAAAVSVQRRTVPTSDGRNAPAQGLPASFRDVEQAFARRLPASLSVALDRLAEQIQGPDAPEPLRAVLPLVRRAAQAASNGDLDTAREHYGAAAAQLPAAILAKAL